MFQTTNQLSNCVISSPYILAMKIRHYVQIPHENIDFPSYKPPFI